MYSMLNLLFEIMSYVTQFKYLMLKSCHKSMAKYIYVSLSVSVIMRFFVNTKCITFCTIMKRNVWSCKAKNVIDSFIWYVNQCKPATKMPYHISVCLFDSIVNYLTIIFTNVVVTISNVFSYTVYFTHTQKHKRQYILFKKKLKKIEKRNEAF